MYLNLFLCKYFTSNKEITSQKRSIFEKAQSDRNTKLSNLPKIKNTYTMTTYDTYYMTNPRIRFYLILQKALTVN